MAGQVPKEKARGDAVKAEVLRYCQNEMVKSFKADGNGPAAIEAPGVPFCVVPKLSEPIAALGPPWMVIAGLTFTIKVFCAKAVTESVTVTVSK